MIDGLASGGVDEYGEPLEGSVEISTYTVDTFTDLCRGPHVEHTGQIPPMAVKLLSVAGAYWRGDEKKPDAPAHLRHGLGQTRGAPGVPGRAGRARKARRSPPRQGARPVFHLDEEVGQGLILWHPNGARMRMQTEPLP